ncbi:uncharacterized protein LOC128213731 [Mya arenaria]|uniref:uncharacterized protein LOC128213731 n=1 Tax=Mya arenaria TaxID=6604 RepID=UPI0022E6B744|nr:uncharacterized protein LOC128213731 [Mya arenaria]
MRKISPSTRHAEVIVGMDIFKSLRSTCKECGCVLDSISKVIRHRREHWKTRPFKCNGPRCIKVFSKLSELQAHRRRHSDHRIYSCRYCHVQYLSLRHKALHRCRFGQQPRYRCGECGSRFHRQLSLSHHIQATHNLVRKKWFKQNSDNLSRVEQCKKDDGKVLLKIKAGRSMTIFKPTETSSQEKKRKHKKMKKKHRKEEKVTGGSLVLSIKKGTVKIPSLEQSEEIHKEAGKETVKANHKAESQGGGLKLRIKTIPRPENDTVNKVRSEKCDNSKDNISCLESMSGNKADKGDEHVSIMEQKIRNGIVIVKDKTGKLSAEQLQKSPRKRNRDNVFDSLKDVSHWKVMPSPRPDGGSDIMKLKLSPQKPLKLVETDDIHSGRYLDSALKTKVDLVSSSDILDFLPTSDKESDTALSNVNDSGIEAEVLSSSSYNRSNGNSVRSVALDENSPTYFNTDGDSLLSVDSPYMDNFHKSEHSICPKCGGVVLETNNNSRSPGKCRCSTSNPNSPFQTPVSPMKQSDIHFGRPPDITVCAVTQEQAVQKCSSPETSLLMCNDKSDSDKLDSCQNNVSKIGSENICETTENVAFASDGEDSDIMIIDIDSRSRVSAGYVPSPDKEFRGKLKLKIKTPRDPSKSPMKRKEEPMYKSGKEPCAIPTNTLNHKKDLLKDENIGAGEKQSMLSKPVSEDVLTESQNSSDNFHLGKGTSNSPVIIIEDDEDPKSFAAKHGLKKEGNKLCRKKPLFKPKAKEDGVKDGSSTPVSACNQAKNSQDNKTKPLLKERSLSGDSAEKVLKKKPLFKKQKSLVERKYSEETNKIPQKEQAKSLCNKTNIKKGNEENLSDKVEVDESQTPVEVSKLKDTKMNQSKLKTISALDDDSLFNLNSELETEDKTVDFEAKPKETVKSPTTTNFGQFQQQFLSFLSTNKPKENQKIKSNKKSLKEKKTVEAKESLTDKGKSKVRETKIVKVTGLQNPMSMKKSNIVAVNESVVCSSVKKGTICNKSAIIEVSAKSKHSKDVHEKETVNEIDDDNEDLLFNHLSNGRNYSQGAESNRKLKHMDSFSWLKIFSDDKPSCEISKPSDTNESVKDVHDVMEGLSEDLAAINQKMDVSDDDDTNSLDMDDVFKAEKLSTLQPKVVIVRPEDVLGNSLPSQPRRRQKAKRTGKFSSRKIKKKIELDYTYSDDSSGNETLDQESQSDVSDPEFNPFDSDDDFVTGPTPAKRRTSSRVCSRSQHSYGTSESEAESLSSDKSDTESQTSRHKRSKQGRKSSCPCCISETEKDHSREQSYKLPRNYKQFIRNTKRLLDIQKKLHTLFITLFPDCSDIISNCKVGTDEFDALMDDVLSGLEQPNNELDPVYHDVADQNNKKILTKDYSECQVNNIGLSFTSPDTATRTSEIDLIPGDEKTSGKLETGKNHSPNHQETSQESDFVYNTGIEPYTSVTHAPSASSLKFENNTLASDNESEGTSPNKKFSQLVSVPMFAKKDGASQSIHQTHSDTSSSLSIFSPVTSVSSTFSSGSKQLAVPENSSQTNPAALHCGISVDTHLTETCMTTPAPSTDASTTSSSVSPLEACHPFSNTADPLGLSSSSGTMSYKGSGYFPIAEPVPMVNITIDLNAARVSLCSSPRHCFQKLQSKVTKLVHFLIPDLEIKTTVCKNIDNLEFLIDLITEANAERDIKMDQDDFPECTEIEPPWTESVPKTLLIPQSESLMFIPITSDNLGSISDDKPLFVACSDMFEENIKSHREFLKRDLFVIEEDHTAQLWKSSDDKVWDSLASLNSIAKKAQSPRKRTRDSRPRKRSADEKRTLFVQEKLQNTHNSTFVCHTHDSVNKMLDSPRKGQKRRYSESSKERFMSGLDLGDRASRISETDGVVSSKCSPVKTEVKLTNVTNHSAHVEKTASDNEKFTAVSHKSKNENTVCDHGDSVAISNDGLKKLGVEKNIFELMLPI